MQAGNELSNLPPKILQAGKSHHQVREQSVKIIDELISTDKFGSYSFRVG